MIRRFQRFELQAFQVTEVFMGYAGKLVNKENIIKVYTMLMNGKLDQQTEIAFYMVGPIENFGKIK
ncbi:ATP synthase subunit beta, mitochondrial-like [Anopheles gambiae]|uniref:ATP synthase subunit beta, mitochondrial-like n=1 Tax=Anopheles gambiae TaxID=7165 RepID=UPI002AC8DFB4|nr:ATP synthase subunit beta, mitochondrial-like [Anopheles gambiae]